MIILQLIDTANHFPIRLISVKPQYQSLLEQCHGLNYQDSSKEVMELWNLIGGYTLAIRNDFGDHIQYENLKQIDKLYWFFYKLEQY